MWICVGVVHLLADEVEYLGRTFCVYVHLNQMDKHRDLRTLISWRGHSANPANTSTEGDLQCQSALTRSARLHSSAFQSNPNAWKRNMLGSVTDQSGIHQPNSFSRCNRGQRPKLTDLTSSSRGIAIYL